ncbi:MAG: dihydropteroate synthase [Selenomonadaceae bacterium]|nr:dihydropteroate synthase [Selenomonadaceae bacterium]
MIFQIRNKKFDLNKKTLIMAILNVTPDSFSDGGSFNKIDKAINHVEKLIESGADIIDIGAESTRPGAISISAEEEIARLDLILKALKNCPVPISVDTYKSKTAEFALNNGVDLINDIHGLQNEIEPLAMAKVAKKFNAPVVSMHNQKISIDVIDDIKKFFRRTLKIADEVGLSRKKIIFDPGIGFNKTQDQNLEILRRLEELKIIDGVEYPLLLGVSRKSVINYALKLPIDQRDEATGAICVLAISKGVNIVRVHNVEMINKMCKMTDVLIKCRSITDKNQ